MALITRRMTLAQAATLVAGSGVLAACGGGSAAGGTSGGAAGGAIKPESGTVAWHLWSAQPEHLEQYQEIFKTQIGAPVLKGLDKTYLELPPPPNNRKAVIDSIQYLKALPKTLKMMEIYDPVYTKQMADAFAGKVSPGEAARQIDSQVAAILAQK